MQKQIVDVALLFAKLCFAVYLILSVAPLVIARQQYKDDQKERAAHPELAGLAAVDFPEIVKALASLVEGLVKAGPALWALIGSMFFLLVAGFAAGLFTTP